MATASFKILKVLRGRSTYTCTNQAASLVCHVDIDSTRKTSRPEAVAILQTAPYNYKSYTKPSMVGHLRTSVGKSNFDDTDAAMVRGCTENVDHQACAAGVMD